MMNTIALSGLLVVLGCVSVNADTPANCTYEDVRGTWTFQIGNSNNEKTVNCSGFSGPYKRTAKIQLLYPDIAIDEFGNKGFWTLIYNQGFEVVVAGRKYFAFSKYVGKTSYCHTILPGWSHDVLGRDWACYTGNKDGGQIVKTSQEQPPSNSLLFSHPINSEEMVESINSAQLSWTAKRYPQFDGYTEEDFIRMAGGRASRVDSLPKARPLTAEHKQMTANLPLKFDWRDVDGVNYLSPVRNQGQCGSCYAFGSLAMCEARVRIQTNNTQTPVFSTQDIVECSSYSQGCEGGFPYLIAGKYAEDFGLVDEKCNPYKGTDGKCHTDPKCARHYFTKYQYVGGYYGGCNEAVMMQAVYERGPIAVGFEVYKDFMMYKSGIYHHHFKTVEGRYDPFELTNHAVLVVGWGMSEKGDKYWIVRNSWGEEWGMGGYFWISRGNDECGIESMAVQSEPIFML